MALLFVVVVTAKFIARRCAWVCAIVRLIDHSISERDVASADWEISTLAQTRGLLGAKLPGGGKEN